MPQINDYSVPELQAQEPVGGLQPNLEAAGAIGRSLENVGNAIGGVADVIHKREAAKETSQVFATFAKGREQWTTELSDQVANPDFDVEEFGKKYDDWVSKQAESLNTGEGKNYFTRQAARLQGALLTAGAKQQAAIAGAAAKADMQEGINSFANTLEKDPDQFMDIKQSGLEGVDAMVQNNPRLAGAAPALREHLNKQLAMAAIRGYAKQDPGSIEDNRPSAGQKALDSGVFDQYLSNDEKTKMEAYVRAQSRAADADKARQAKSVEQIQTKQVEDWQQTSLPRLMNNNLSAREVMDAKLEDGSPLPFDRKLAWLKLIDEHAKKDFQTDPHLKADLIARMNLPEDDPRRVSTQDEIREHVGKGLSLEDAGKMFHYLKGTPEQQAIAANEKNLLNLAKKKILKDALTTRGTDATSVARYNMFFDDLQHAKENLRKQGRPMSDLFDPNSKEYFGNKVGDEKYQVSMSEMLENSKPVMKKADPKDPNARKPGESAADYLKRRKGG